MLKLSFVKYEGAGNDFLFFDDRIPSFPFSHREQIRGLCHRTRGVGADGVVFLCLDPDADFKMRIFNSDGGEAASCGNALRCLSLFLRELGLPEIPYTIRIGEQFVDICWLGGRPTVVMERPKSLRFNLETEYGLVHFAHAGVPHAMQFIPDVNAIDLKTLAPPLRHHPFFAPNGANVDFAEILPDNSIRVRTFERGVEGETLACGTGAVAIAAIFPLLYGGRISRYFHFPGGALEVWESKDRIYLTGPASKTFEGTVLIERMSAK